MTSRERVIAALERREPDLVPIHEADIHKHVVQEVVPGGTYYDLVEELDLDTVGPGEVYDYTTGVEVIDAERHIIRDQWGVIRGFGIGEEAAGYPIEGPIKSEKDLLAYKLPDPEAEGVLGRLPEAVERFKGKRAIFGFGRDAFINPSYLRGMENLLMDFVANPRFAHQVIDLSQEYFFRANERVVEAGADIIILGDDYANKSGPLMSPEHFEEFVLPGLTKMVRHLKERGAYVIKHTDGNIWPILDMIVSAGIDAINPLEPVVGMDIGEVKKKYGDRVCVVGNIDCGDLLCRRSPEEVEEAVKECIAKASPGGGHVIASSNTIHSGVKTENYLAMVRAARKYGRYPIGTA